MPRETQSERFKSLVDTHRVRAIRLAWRLLGQHHGAAEDVAQQAFMKAWSKFDSFRDEAALSTWLTTIVVNQVRSYLRWLHIRQRAQRFIGIEATTTQIPRDPGLSQRLISAMEALSPNQREAFILVYLEDHSIPEAAQCLGRAPGTVKSHLHRAIGKLRLSLSDLKDNAS